MDSIFFRSLFISFLISGCCELSAAGPDQPPIIYAWQLHDFYTEKDSVEIDTTINAFQINNPVLRQSISSSFLGNVGLAAFPNIFGDRQESSGFFFIDHFRIYLPRSPEITFYNTRRPFSLIDFSTGGPRGKNEKILNVLHTQNVNPDFNLGFRYFNINSEGQYNFQQAVTNSISFFSSYELDNYQLHAGINLNSGRIFENGGLADDSSLYREGLETEDHMVRLQNVRNGMKNTSAFVSQTWQPFLFSGNETANEQGTSWVQRFKLYHVLQFDQYIRTYQDDNPQSGFYTENLQDNARTFDSLHYRTITNKLMVQLPEFSRGSVNFAAKGGIKNELLKGSYNIRKDTVYHFSSIEVPLYYFLAEPDDYTIIDREGHSHNSNAVIASARGNIGDVFGIWGKGSFFFHGYRQGEYDLHAGIRFDLLEGKNRSVLEADIMQRETTPPVFMNSFSSNHFQWQNDFSRQGESRIRGVIEMPGRGLSAGMSFHLLNNYIYFDTTANPRQFTNAFPVINISLGKDFRLWRFCFRNIVEYQVSGNQEILPLPDLAVYSSTWFEQTLIRGIMNVQIGFDIYYTTMYRGYAYQPAISQFYLQDEKSLGNYPYMDAFINIKHKRARVFFKAEHVNIGLLDPEYFTVLHYPRNERVFKLGISWSFYN